MKKTLFLLCITFCLLFSLLYCGALADDHEHRYTIPGGVKTPATCTSTGVKVMKCFCGATKEYSIPKTGHSYGAWKFTPGKEPTCTEDGEETRSCSGCGARDRRTAPAQHTWGEWVVERMEDCVNSGLRHHTCTVCQTTESDEPEALGHDMTVITRQTCTEDGLAHCKRCDQDVVIPAAHKWRETKKSTCQTPGTRKCTVRGCGATEELPLGDHNWKVQAKATCYAAGARKCTTRGCTAVDEIPMTEHKWDSKKEVASTCSTPGSRTCSEKKCQFVEEIPTLPHTPVVTIQAQEPTCTQEGCTVGEVCSVCQAVTSESTPIPSLGHVFQVGEVIEAQEGIDGYTLFTCSRCGETTKDLFTHWVRSEHLPFILTVEDTETAFDLSLKENVLYCSCDTAGPGIVRMCFTQDQVDQLTADGVMHLVLTMGEHSADLMLSLMSDSTVQGITDELGGIDHYAISIDPQRGAADLALFHADTILSLRGLLTK